MFNDFQTVNINASTFNCVGRDVINIHRLHDRHSIIETLEKSAIVSAAYNSYERSSEHASTCAEDTRVSILNDILDWARSNDHYRMCLLSGRAGTGKSTIAHTIAEQCDREHRLGFSFFFSRRNRDRSDMTKFIPTLAYQLSIFLPAIRDSMKRAVARNPAIFHQRPNIQLTKLVIDPLLSIVDSLSTMTIVIDGLDEYDGEVPLAELVALFRDLSDRHPFRIFFTSRPEAQIHQIFDTPSVASQTYRLTLRDSTSRDEIRTLLRSRLSTVRDIRGLPSTWPSTVEFNQLVKQCDGLYICAEMLIRFIGDEYGSPPERLQAVLNTYSGMDPLYNQILRTGRWNAAFEQVMGSIVYLAPLTIGALAELLQLSSDRIRVALQGCLSILVVPDDDGDYIRPYHPSLRGFFTDQERAKDHFLDPLQYNLSIMDDCVKLLHGSLANDAEGRESVRYACRYWCHHLRMAVSCTGGVDHVTSDVKTRMIELMKNLQSPWLKNWMVILENVQNVKKVHEDLVALCQAQPSDGKSSAVFPELRELLETVGNFLEAPQWITNSLTDEYSDSKQLPEILETLQDEALQRSTLQEGPSIPAQPSPTILSAVDEKEELFDDSVIDGDARISHISKIAVHHCGTVYKLEVHYVLDNETTVVREHGNPTIPQSELVSDTIALDSERLVEVEGVASPGLIWQLKFVSENVENQKRCEYGPYGENIGINIWPGIYRFRVMGNIIAFGGSTGFGMLTGLSFITDGSPLKMELGVMGDGRGDIKEAAGASR